MRRKRKQKDEFLAELAKYSRMHPPLSPRFVRMTQPPMRILYFLQRNDEAAAFAERLRGAGVPVHQMSGTAPCLLLTVNDSQYETALRAAYRAVF